MIKFYLVLFVLSLSPAFSWAQESVSGTITATDEPAGLPGATVSIEGTKRGTASGANGSYSLPLELGDSVLVISFVGYTPQRLVIAGRSVVDVVLSPLVKETEEVVVVGYGTQRKSDLTGSVSSLRGTDITKVPSQNAVQSLQGKVTGVQIASPNGAPGSAPVVRIRGVGTLSAAGNNPLFVVDGAFMSDINAINAQDIESIEVLKDASAAAIFGIFGANGVIIVTTKRGKAGKPSFSFSTEVGVQNLPKKIDLLSGREYAEVIEELRPGTYNNFDRVPNTDWQDLVFRKNAPIQNHQFSASGGTDVSTFYFGLGYFKQEGLIPKSSFERISLRVNNNFKLSKQWDLGTNLTVTPTKSRFSPNVTPTLYRAPGVIAPYSDTTPSPFTPVNTYGNPLADLEYNSNNYYKGVNAIGNVYTEYSLPAGFKYRFNFGFDLGSGRNTNFTPQYFVNGPQSTPFARLSTSRNLNSNLLADNLLYYKKEFGKHGIDAFVGTSVYTFFNIGLTARAQQLLSNAPSAWYLGTGIVPANGASEPVGQRRQRSFFGRINYSFAGRYSLTFTQRYDGSSLFPSTSRYASFPSAGAAWNVSEENFMKEVRAFNTLKVRASIGQLGNQAVDANSQNARFNLINANTPAVFGPDNLLTQGASVGVTSNPNLGWETTTQKDLGLEMSFLKGKLAFEADYYHRTTDNILAALTTPGYFGNGAGVKILYNAANVTNSGFEGNLQWRDNAGDVGYRIGALFTTVKNTVKDLGSTGQAANFISSGGREGSFLSRTQVGQPIGSFYGYQVAGVFQTEGDIANSPSQSNVQSGDLKFKDQNGDGKIDANDRVILGSSIPSFIFGFNGGLNFHGFDLSADFQGQTGNKIYNAKEVVRPGETNFEGKYRSRWTPSNPSTNMPRATNNGNNYLPSDFFLQKGDFLRLRTLTLAYALPPTLTKTLGMQAASIYIRGTNLKTWTKFSGYTPEIGNGDDLSAGLDDGVYPLAKVYAIGANITF